MLTSYPPKLRLWARKWDKFRDIPYWQHSLTFETIWQEPSLEFIIEHSKWSFPPKTPEQTTNLIDAKNEATSRLDKEALNAAMNILKKRKGAMQKNER